MTAGVDRPLWTCPTCGRSFANKNQAHACQTTSVDEYLSGKSELAVSIYEGVVGLLERAGNFRIHPQKTRISFISRMTFGGLTLAKRWADLSFILPEPLDDRRVRKLELYGPTSWGHTVRLSSLSDIDEDVEMWLTSALMRGNQETLDPDAEVAPLVGRQLDVFWTGFRGRIGGEGDESIIRLPRHIAEALELVDTVSAKVAGVETRVELERTEDGATLLPVSAELGLGEGDETDVFIKVED